MGALNVGNIKLELERAKARARRPRLNAVHAIHEQKARLSPGPDSSKAHRLFESQLGSFTKIIINLSINSKARRA